MKKLIILFAIMIVTGIINMSYSQENNSSNLEYSMSVEEQIILFGGFASAVIVLFLYIARDLIFRKKTKYDEQEFESKKDKTYEKYHSDWTDDYVDFTYTRPSEDDERFRKAVKESTLPDYYKILEIPRTATHEDIKKRYRELAKKLHPDRSKDKSTEDAMAEINKAYEILSNKERRKKYDKYLNIE